MLTLRIKEVKNGWCVEVMDKTGCLLVPVKKFPTKGPAIKATGHFLIGYGEGLCIKEEKEKS